MNVHVETDLARISKDEWNRLAALSPSSTVFQTYQWHAAWWAAYGTDKRGFILSVVENGLLLGLAPLMLERGGAGPKTLSFIGTGRSDYLDFIYPPDRPDVLEAMVRFLRDQRGEWDTIDLVRVTDRSETAKSLPGICSNNRLYCHVTGTIQSPTLRFVYDPAGKAVNLADQKKVSRHQSYFRRQEGYRVQHLTDGPAISGYLDAFFDQHVARWTETDTPSLFVDENNRAFYRELVAVMAPTGWLLLTVMEALGKPFAFLLSFVYRNRLLGYKQSFDMSLAKRSPGDALVREVRDYAIAGRLDEFDFSVGAEPYKLRFANDIRHNLSYRIHRSRSRFLIDRGLTIVKIEMRRTRLGKSLVGRIGRFREVYVPTAREAIRKRGLAGFAWRNAKRLFKKLIFEYVCSLFFEIPAGETVVEWDNAALEGITFREAKMEDLLTFQYSDYQAMMEEYLMNARKRFAKGDRCFIAEHGGRTVYAFWSREETDTYVREARTWVELGPDAVSLYDGLTVPHYRNKGLGRFTLSRALNVLKDKKRTSYCMWTNRPSASYLRRCGFRLTQRQHMIRVLGIPIRWQTKVPTGDPGSRKA